MPIEVLLRASEREIVLPPIPEGLPGSFSDYSEEPPLVISALCSSGAGRVYHFTGNTQAGSKFTLIDASMYNDENLVKELTPEDDTYERDIVTKGGHAGRLVLKLS